MHSGQVRMAPSSIAGDSQKLGVAQASLTLVWAALHCGCQPAVGTTAAHARPWSSRQPLEHRLSLAEEGPGSLCQALGTMTATAGPDSRHHQELPQLCCPVGPLWPRSRQPTSGCDLLVPTGRCASCAAGSAAPVRVGWQTAWTPVSLQPLPTDGDSMETVT